jgi:hypothetical protein
MYIGEVRLDLVVLERLPHSVLDLSLVNLDPMHLLQLVFRLLQRLLRQYLYFCTSKASKLSTKAEYPPASSLQALLLLPSCPAEEVGLLRRRQRAAAAAAAAPPTQKHTYTHHMRITHERIHTTNARTHACVHTHTRTHTHTHTQITFLIRMTRLWASHAHRVRET